MQKPIIAVMFFCAASAALAQGAAGIGKTAGGGADDSGSTDGEASKPVLAEENHRFYVGADYQNAKLSVSDPGSVGGIPQGDYDSTFADLRFGYRVFDAVGAELHYGIPTQDNSGNPSRVTANHYYAAFVVPTATLFESFELALPIGYARSIVKHSVADDSADVQSAHLNSVAYGARFELPVRVLWSALPDVRLTGGGTVYCQKTGARDYGFSYGLRYDFGS